MSPWRHFTRQTRRSHPWAPREPWGIMHVRYREINGSDGRVANQICRHADTPEINLKALFDILYENRMKHQCHLDCYQRAIRNAWRREWPKQRVYERSCLSFSSQ